MRRKQHKPKRIQRSLKKYSQDQLALAYEAVKENTMPVNRAALTFGVPAQTLRDRVLGKVNVNAAFGGKTVFLKEEETILVNHIEQLSLLGYGLNRKQVNILAAELAIKLGRRDAEKKFSNNWHYGFMKRWNDRLSLMKPRSLTSTRAQCLKREKVSEYFTELNATLEKYDLKSKPHLIYNLDETGLQPEHRSASVISSKGGRPQAITSPRSTTTTLIACINAAGNALPPYFVFKGKKNNQELLKGALPGTGMAMSDSGWSNSSIFKTYLEDHFLKYVQAGKGEDHILLIYDGHTSHVTSDVIEWAKTNKIVLFVLPPHTSHLLQPLDVGCFGPFKGTYYSECSLWMSQQRGRVITKYEICELSSKAFGKTITTNNILASFRKTGISPYNSDVVTEEKFIPAQSFPKVPSGEGKEIIEDILKEKLEQSAPVLAQKKTVHDVNNMNQNKKRKRPSLGGKRNN